MELNEEKLQELLQYAQCNVFLSDKITLCSKECIEIIVMGEDKSILPVCAGHYERLEKGESFLIMELSGQRNFAISLGSGTPPPDTATIPEPDSSEPPTEQVEGP